MPSDVYVNNVPRRADDRDAGAIHTRSKVILSHVAWLLQMKGIQEVGELEFGENGYMQRFRARNAVPIEITTTPTEPAQVKVFIKTQPAMAFRVDAVGEDGKTMDVSVLSQTIADGIDHIARALRLDQPKSPKTDKEEKQKGTVPRTDLNPNATRGGRPSANVATRPDSGNVTTQVKEAARAVPVGRKEKSEEEDDVETQRFPTQFIAQIASFWDRFQIQPLVQDLAVDVEVALRSAKRGDWKDLKSALNKVGGELEKRSNGDHDSRVLAGLRREFNDLRDQFKGLTDVRKKVEKEGEKQSAVDRLRAVVKPENFSKSPGMAGGSGHAILARTRGLKVPGKPLPNAMEKLRKVNEDIPEKDEFVSLSPGKLHDFVKLFKSVVNSYVTPQPYTFKYSSGRRAWSMLGKDWEFAFRCEQKKDKSWYGWIETFAVKDGKVRRLDVYDFPRATSYDDLTIQLATHVAQQMKQHKIGMKKS